MAKGITLIVATALISGVSIFLNAYGIKGFDSAVFTFGKNVLVGLALLSIILLLGNRRSLAALTLRQWGQLSLIGLVGGSVPFLLFFKGLSMASGSTAAFLHKTMFLFVAVLASVFLKEKLSRGWLIGSAILLLGNGLLLVPDLSFSIWHLLVLVATLLWAAENVISKHALRSIPGTVVAFGRMGIGSIFLILYLFATGKAPLLASMSGAQWGWIGLTALLLLGYVATYYNGLATVKASTATSILLLGSPVTLLLDWAFRGAVLGSLQLLGILSIAAGLLVMSWWRVPVISHARH